MDCLPLKGKNLGVMLRNKSLKSFLFPPGDVGRGAESSLPFPFSGNIPSLTPREVNCIAQNPEFFSCNVLHRLEKN